MRKIASIFSIVILSSIVFITTNVSATPPNPDHKVTLCHRTGSESNPYVIITTDIASDGYVQGGHDQHEQVGNGYGGDIIPAYQYTARDGSVFNYPGKNLGSGGSEILANGCQVPSTTTTVPIVVSPEPTNPKPPEPTNPKPPEPTNPKPPEPT